MLENKVYSFSELKTILNEEKQKNEFKPKFGKGYSVKTEENQNEKAVKDIATDTKEFDGGLKDNVTRRNNPEGIDDKNKTTLDYDYAYEPSDTYKERVKSQVHGYTSKSAEDNDKEDDQVGDFEGNKDFYEKRKEIRNQNAEDEYEDKVAGLKTSKLPEKTKQETFKDKTLYTESKKMKRLHFKNTIFLNESQMLQRIPDDYKVDGNKFIMKDSKGNEYLVECKKDSLCEDYIHVNVLEHYCGNKVIVEQLDNFYRLAEYKSSNYNTKVEQLNEANNYGDMLNITRKLIAEGAEKK